MYAIDKTKVVSEIFNDEAIIVDLRSGAYFSFRGSAIAIWQLINAGYTHEEILDFFKREESVQGFIDFLLTENLVTPAPVAVAKEEIVVASEFAKPEYRKYDDMKELLLLDPIHEVDKMGWPHQKPE